MLKNLKIPFRDLIFAIFPIIILSRSFIINFYLIACSIYFLWNIKNIKYKSEIFEIFKYFLLFCIYIFILSFLNGDNFKSILSSIGLIRFALFSLFIFSVVNLKSLHNIFFFQLMIVLFVSLDGIIQFYFGKNIVGFEAINHEDYFRLGGLFGDELVLGSFLTHISIPLFSYFFLNLKNLSLNKKYFIYFALFATFIAILLSGERMAFIIFLFFIILFLILNFKKRMIIYSLLTIFFSLSVIYNVNDRVEQRVDDFTTNVLNFKSSDHGKLFGTSIELWKEKPITGYGKKNYRVICKNNKENISTKKINYLCSTHPHNTNLELLVETGLIGIIIFYFFLIKLVIFVSKNKEYLDKYSKSFIFGSMFVVLIYFWPIRSSGSFFSTFNSTFFWYNLGILLLITKKKHFEK